MLLRSVSSPRPSTIAFLTAGSTMASAVAWNRVPMTAPLAPSTSAAASPRPSAIPPAASTGIGATRSTTAGTNGSVDRPWRGPGPPRLRALSHDHVGPQIHGLPSLIHGRDLQYECGRRLPDRLGQRGRGPRTQQHPPRIALPH